MNSKTRSLLYDIKTKVKSPISGTNEFANDDAILELAIRRLYESFKQQKLL